MIHAVLSLLKEARHPLRIHLIGVAGSGMSGLASLLLNLGHKVSGSDQHSNSETARLEKQGLLFYRSQTEQEVNGADMVIYSSAVKTGNPAFDAAHRQGIPLVRRAEALAAIMAGKDGVIVAGTHGKTTTSSMTAHVLRVGGVKPSHYVGAEIPILGTNAHWDHEGSLFVAEGDESDGSLVNFHPKHAILLNIEAEHLDFYKDIEAIKEVFRRLLAQTSEEAIYCGEDPVASELCADREKAVSYGWQRSHDFSAEILNLQPTQTEFLVYEKGKELGTITLGIPGKHNVLNALAAIALGTKTGVAFDQIRQALASFRGAKRRFEVKYNGTNFQVIDDYGHHPTEIQATLATAKALNRGRILCLFQPHRYSRTQLLKEEFGKAFADVDVLCVTDIYAASEKPLPGVSGQTILDQVQENFPGKPCYSTPKMVDGKRQLAQIAKPGDLIITLGAGNVHEVATGLAKDLKIAEAIQEILDADGGGLVKLQEPMAVHTTFRIGGPAQFWIEPRSIDAFVRVVNFLRLEAIPVRVIGRGSNLLVRDGGIKGAVIHPSKGEFDEVRVEGNRIFAGAGVRLKKLASTARNAGLGGFEWMEGIPGNLGGALRMNAGAMGRQTFDQIVSVKMLDSGGSLVEKNKAEIEHFYRSVPELETCFAVSAVLEGAPAPLEEIDAKLAESHQKRRSSQPIGANAGCVFKNPDSTPAGKLVDELQWKGKGIGAAKVSEEHGNFILNTGKAPAQDVLDLIHKIQETAFQERGVVLETEVQIIGESETQPL